MSSMSITENPLTDLWHLRFGVTQVKAGAAVLQAENINGVGSLLQRSGVTAESLQRLGLSPVNAKAVLGAEGWRGAVNVSKQLSKSVVSPGMGSSMLESVKSGWGSFETQMPNLAKSAKSASTACKALASNA